MIRPYGTTVSTVAHMTRLFLVLGSVASLCENVRAADAPDETTSTQAPPAPTAPSTASAYSYTPTNKRDPFKPPLRYDQDEDSAALPAIQRYTLDQLRLTTILWSTPELGEPSRAMFKDPKNRNYILKEGDKIGKNDGVILKINKNEVTIVEKYKDPFGNESIKETPIYPMSGTGSKAMQ